MPANSLCKEKTSIRRILPKEKSAIVLTILFSLIFSLSFIPFFRRINANFMLSAVALIVGGGLHS